MSYKDETSRDEQAVKEFLTKRIKKLKLDKSTTEYWRDYRGFNKEGCNYQIRSCDRQIKILTKLLKEV